MEEFIQIGTMAFRDAETGQFLPAEPIYRRVTPNLERQEQILTMDIAKIFAQKMKQYIDGGGLIGKTRTGR